MFDSSKQYTQPELPSDIFNSGNGDIKNYNGRAVQVQVNNNGTRNVSDLGDWNTYQSNKSIGDATAANKAANDARFASDKADLTDFNTRYSTAVPKIVGDTSTKYNLGGLLNIANGLNSRISTLSGNTDNSGAGGFSSADQVDAAVNSRYLPQYQSAVSNLNTGTTLAQNEESTLLSPYTTEAGLLNDRMAREATAYTAEQQSELSALVAKMQAGVALTQTEMDNANALALKHIDYEQALATAKINNSNVTIPSGSTYFSPGSGQVYNPFVPAIGQ